MDIKHRLYPHPVLWEMTDDYKNSSFDCRIDLERGIREFILQAEFRLQNPEIEEMIARDEAEYLLHIEGPAASCRLIKKSKEKEMLVRLKDEHLLGRVSICPFLVAKKALHDFYNSDWNGDYLSAGFEIEKGTILAIGMQQSFFVDKEMENLSEPSSIFTVYRKETEEEMPMEVEVHADKLRIGLNKRDYRHYAQFKYHREDTLDILNSFIIYPALLFVFERLRENFEEYREYRWFRAMEKMFLRYGQLFDEDLLNLKSSMELAQALMSYPVSRALASLNNNQHQEEDSL